MKGIWVPLAMFLLAARATPAEDFKLRVLLPGCTLSKTWIGIVPHMPYALALRCGGAPPVVVVHPNNLVGLVAVNTEADSLEYVRFFSRPDVASLVMLDGVVELREDVQARIGTDDTEFNLVRPAVFRRWLKNPKVKSFVHSTSKLNEGLAGAVAFQVTRSVVFPNGQIYEIDEFVSTGGYYARSSKRLILKSSHRVGVQYPADN
jgi:hypothetical protein